MARRNKKLGVKNREKVMISESKLKKDFINFYDYCNFFYDVYNAEEDKKCRENLKNWNEENTGDEE